MAEERIEVEGGKYTVVIGENGGLKALRYGEPWQDLLGNKFVYCLATELQQARDDLAEAKAELARRPPLTFGTSTDLGITEHDVRAFVAMATKLGVGPGVLREIGEQDTLTIHYRRFANSQMAFGHAFGSTWVHKSDIVYGVTSLMEYIHNRAIEQAHMQAKIHAAPAEALSKIRALAVIPTHE